MFRNKVVIITGGSNGIGAATAQCFAKEGASLAIVGRNEAKLKSVAKVCEDLGATVLLIKADVSIDNQAKTIVKKTVEKFGKLDILINNAGVLRFAGIHENNLMQVFDEIVNTNLRSIFHITNLAVPYLKETKGNIVNVSSVSARLTFPGMSAYCVSKAGVDHFTRCAAAELASSGVRVNAVNPGPVQTEMLDELTVKLGIGESGGADFTVLGRVSEGKEVSDLVAYLASEKAKGITGSCYLIDNGVMLK